MIPTLSTLSLLPIVAVLHTVPACSPPRQHVRDVSVQATPTAAPIDTTARDSGGVVLTDSVMRTMFRLDTALTAVVKLHPDLQPVYKGLIGVNPYAIAKAPPLVAVIKEAGWTPMDFARAYEAYMTALEGSMPFMLQGGRAPSQSLAHRNINFILDHKDEYGIKMNTDFDPGATNGSAP